MGKKSKKLVKTEDQPQLTNVDKSMLQDATDANDSKISIPKSKKKNRKRDVKGASIEDTAEQIRSEVKETDAPANLITTESTETKKKKNKKSKLLVETEPELTEVEDHNHKPSKDSKKKQNKGNLLHGQNSVEETPQTVNEQVKQKKKSKSKAKTGAPVLNDEESQVTEEDIDKFCDELDEEDNKQYEDWVKLLDARLSKKQPQKK